MMSKKNVIHQIIVLLTVYAFFGSWPAFSGGAAEKLVNERLQAESPLNTAGSTPRQLTASKSASSKGNKYSSASVWIPKESWPAWLTIWQECNSINCVLDYMKKSGASEEAIKFSREINDKLFGVTGYLEKFEEKGLIDLGFVMLPGRANTNGAYVLLNGSQPLISTEPDPEYEPDITRDPNYPSLKQQYPNLIFWTAQASFISAQAKADGGQRFIFSYNLLNGGHAGEVLGTGEVAFDFDRYGVFKGTKLLKLVPDEIRQLPVVKNGSGEIKKLSPFLSFPLECGGVDKNKNCIFRYTDGAYTQKSINSVLDHHMDYPYVADGAVIAFTGEKGKGALRKMGCYPKVGGGAFSVDGLYKGTQTDTEDCSPSHGLNYDGHPGYDYKAEKGMDVKAAYGGKVVNILNTSTNTYGRCVPRGIDKTGGCEAWGYVGIDHGNGYVTQYGHLSKINDEILQQGATVKKGDKIGLSGEKGVDGNPHLHFEVLKVKERARYGYTFVDPYGWEGLPNEDDLENVTEIKNVRLWDYPPEAFTHSAIKDDIHHKEYLTTNSKLKLDGIGSIRVGMTVSEASKVIELTGYGNGVASNECSYVKPKNGPSGIDFMVTNNQIACIDINSTEFTTAEGARIGSTEAEILKYYPGNIEVKPHQYIENGHYLIFRSPDARYQNYRLIFETDGTHVTTFRAGKIPEAGWVERCG